MNAPKYFVVNSGESGIRIEEITPKELKKRIEEGYYGQRSGRFYESVPKCDDGHFMQLEGEEALLIIKGEIIVPQAKKVVTEFEVP